MVPALVATRAKPGLSGGSQGIVYGLTEAGENLLPVVENLAEWGKAWLPARLSDENADPIC